MNCVFCSIVKGEIPCHKIYEDEHILAFLDIADDVEGHTLVIPKKHIENMNSCSEQDFKRVLAAAKKVSDHYVKLGYKGTSLAIVGLDVNHLHVHVLPRKKNENCLKISAQKHDLNLEEIAKKLRMN